MLTYDIVRDVRCRTYDSDVVRLYPVYDRTYDIVRAMFNTMSYVARTMSYVHDLRHRMYDIVGGKNPDEIRKTCRIICKIVWTNMQNNMHNMHNI